MALAYRDVRGTSDRRQDEPIDYRLLVEVDTVVGAAEWRRLVGETFRLLLGVVIAYGIDADSAEDVVQNSYIKAINNINRYNPADGTLWAWLRKIVVNTAVDFRRRRARGRIVGKVPESVAAPGPSPHDLVTDHEIAARVASAVAALPTAQRRAVTARYIEGLSHEEAALTLGTSLGAQKVNASRGCAKLRLRLGNSR